MKYIKTFEAITIDALYKYSRIVSNETGEDWYRVFQALYPLLVDKKDYVWLYAGIKDKTPDQWEVDDQTGLLNVYGGFELDSRKEEIENFGSIKFGLIEGDFKVKDNVLQSLDGSPREVTGVFDVSGNAITSIKGAPEKVKRGFIISNNDISSLEGGPTSVGHEYMCSRNPRLKSLKGLPDKFNVLYAEDCNLSDLDHLPKKLEAVYARNNNIKDFKSLEGVSIDHLDVSSNPIVSIEGIDPKLVKNVRFNGSTGVSDESLRSIFKTMREENVPYSKAVALNWNSLPDEDKKIIDKGDLDDSEFKKLVRFSKLKNSPEI